MGIGGFFELELNEGSYKYHSKAIELATGRACLSYILETIKPERVYLPYYCCNALFEPLIERSIEYQFYRVNAEFEIENLPIIKDNDLIIYCNFFGIKSHYLNGLIETYKKRLIVDNSHSFFALECNPSISFTTARKYFGVPDGAYLYFKSNQDIDEKCERNTDISLTHNLNRLIGKQAKGFKQFTAYEKSLNAEIKYISKASQLLLSNVNYKEVRRIRNRNFHFFERQLNDINRINFMSNTEDCFCYPLWLNKPLPKNKLYEQGIFVPTYWEDVLKREDSSNYSLECKMTIEILPLPIDHRYSDIELQKVINIIKSEVYG